MGTQLQGRFVVPVPVAPPRDSQTGDDSGSSGRGDGEVNSAIAVTPLIDDVSDVLKLIGVVTPGTENEPQGKLVLNYDLLCTVRV